MDSYIATFFSHFGAMSFKKKCDKEGYPGSCYASATELKFFLWNLCKVLRECAGCRKMAF